MANVIEALRYLIGAAWEGDTAVARAKGDITDLGDTTAKVEQKSGRDWVSMGKSALAFGATVGGAALTAKKAYELIGEGADLIRAEDQFGRLAASIESTADVMLGKLKEATGGLVSDAELVNSATQIMSLGLQNTEDGVVRLAAVSGKLGWDMGTVILTMANNSKMRLDALGLSIEDVDAKTEKFIAQGMSMDQAFDMAVIEAGEAKVELLGDAADTTAGQLKIFETGVKNAQDEFKISLVEGFADGLSDIAANAQDAGREMEIAAKGAGTLVGTLLGGTLGSLGKEMSLSAVVDFSVDQGTISELDALRIKFFGNSSRQYSPEFDEEVRQLERLKRGYDALMAASRGQNNNFVDLYAQEQAAKAAEDAARAQLANSHAMNIARNEADALLLSYELAGIATANLKRETESAAWNTEHFGGTLGLTDEELLAVYGSLGLTEGSMGRLGAAAEEVRNTFDLLNAELDELDGKTVDVYVNGTIEQKLRRDANDDELQNYYGGGGTGGDDRPVPAAPVGGIPGVPSTGGPVSPNAPNVTVNNYNEQTAALNAALVAQALRAQSRQRAW